MAAVSLAMPAARAQYPPPRGSMTCTVSQGQVQTGASATVSATVLDVDGGAVPDTVVSFSLETAPDDASLSSAESTTDADGVASVDLQAGASAGPATVVASLDDLDCRVVVNIVAATPTPTETPSATPTPTLVPTSTATPAPTATSTVVATETNTAVPTAAGTTVPTATDTPVPTATDTAVPTATNTPLPPAMDTPQPTSTAPPPTATLEPLALVADSPTATPSPSPTATARASTPTPTPSPTPSPTPTPPPPAGPDDRPDIFAVVKGIGDISTDPAVIGTSALIAALLILLVAAESAIFNAAIKENSAYIEAALLPLLAPIRAFARGWDAPGTFFSSSLLRGTAITVLSAVIYCFTDPEVGFNAASAVLFLSFLVAMTYATYIYDGLQVVVAERKFGLPSTLRIFPVGVLIAIACVLISRLTDLKPGLLYGFVAAATILAPRRPEEHEDAQIVLIPLLSMIGVSLVAWLLITPARSLGADDFWTAVLEGVLVGVFLTGLQGALLNLIPLEFMDGLKLWRWSKLTWIAISVPLAFVFVHVMLQDDNDVSSLSSNHAMRVLFLLCLVSAIFTAVAWLYFHRRSRLAEGEE